MHDVIEQIKSQDLKFYLEKHDHIFKGNMTLCPFHDDTVPSMSVDHKNGSWVWHCHSCEQGGTIIDYEMKRAELTTAEAIKKLANHFNFESSKPKVVTQYSYTDEQGNELFKIIRYHPKTFRADRKMAGVRRVVYRLSEVLGAKSVWLVEGEKDADNLSKLGLTATTTPFGVSNWKKEFTQYFKDKEVMICLDRGCQKEAERRARDLTRVAKEVKIITLPGLEREGQDISDWIELQDSKTSEELVELLHGIVEKTPIFKPGIEKIEAEIWENSTDLGNARRFARQHCKDTKFCHLWGKWLNFTGARWEKDETGEVKRKARATVKSIYEEASRSESKEARREKAKFAMRSESAPKIRAMLSLAESEPEIPIRPKELDTDPWFFNVQNGTLNLKTEELQPHNHKDFISKLAPVVFDKNAKCPRWEKFLNEIMDGNESLISFLQKAVGYSLTGDTREQCLFIPYGTGANGKTTLLQIISTLMGDYGQQSPIETLSLRRFSGVPNDVARLRGARFVSSIEVEEGRRIAESLVKALTGGDTITARFLFSEYFEFIPQFKLFLGTNHKPIIRGTDLAIWRRIRLIPFQVTIPEDKQDKELGNKLKQELPGILNWALEGCLQWQKEGLGTPEEVREATEEYRKESDILASFLEENTSMDKEGMIKSSVLYSHYREWCEENGEKSISSTAFGKALLEKGVDKMRLRNGIHYLGLKLEEICE